MTEPTEPPPVDMALAKGRSINKFEAWFDSYWHRKPDDRQQDQFVKAAFLVAYQMGQDDMLDVYDPIT